MKINILHCVDGAKKAKGATVVIDVFRAFSVEAYLMNSGVKKIYPIGDVDLAYKMKEENKDYILIGERGGKILPGFDFGNSPFQIKDSNLDSKVVVHTTSAGTQGIANAVNSSVILTGSLVNAKAIAKYLKDNNFDEISLVCMGTDGKESSEDTLCANYIKSILEGNELDLALEIEKLKETSGAKFFKEDLKEIFPTEDFYMCTDANKFNFVLKVFDDNGMNCIERIDL